jgi:hypothetical protein
MMRRMKVRENLTNLRRISYGSMHVQNHSRKLHGDAAGNHVILEELAATNIVGGTIGCALALFWNLRIAINHFLEILPGDRRVQKLGDEHVRRSKSA